MRRFKRSRLLVTTATVALFWACFYSPATAAQKVPIQFESYHGFTASAGYLKAVAKAYPGITELLEIGKSTMGRPIYVLVVSNQKNGATIDALVSLQNKRKEGVNNVTALKPYQGKPGHWIGGATHGNEYTGTEVSLYIIDKLVTGYGSDETITRMVDNNTFYICPIINPDGVFNSVEKGIPQRANSMRRDDDGDGKINEDGPDDLDGDGNITFFRYKDPKGLYIVDDKEPRLMVRLRQGEQSERQHYSVIQEDFDNDGDGRINEDDIGGPDPNRNYPYGWNLPAGNPYPMSEPCTRNVFEFQLAHPNIFASFHYHNTGRLIMFQAPPAVRSRDQNPQAQERRQQMMERRLEEMRKTNKYAQMFDRQVAPDDQHDMDVQTEIATAGARILKNYTPVIGGLSGQANAAAYYMLGAYSYLIELWGTPDFDADMNADGRVSDEEYLEWVDMDLNGEGWINPHKVSHPDLGEIWIGGTPKKHMRRTPPSRYIEQEAFKNTQFVLYCASQFPRVEITDITVNPVNDKLLWVEVTVKNDRVYPTYSDRTAKLKRAGNDTIVMKTSSGIKPVELPKGITVLDPFDSKDSFETITADGTSFRLKGKETKRFCALVEWTGSKGWVEISATSKFGGTTNKKITIQKN